MKQLLFFAILLWAFESHAAALPPHIQLELSDEASRIARTNENYLPQLVRDLKLNQADIVPVFWEPRNEKMRTDWYAFGLHRFFRLTWSGEELNAEAIGKTLEAQAKTDREILSVFISYPHEALDIPNDYSIVDMWGLQIMNCPEAWDVTHGNHSVIVTTIDTGCDLFHADLAANVYVNPAEDLNHNNLWDESDNNNIDDDGNGFVDDISGWDFVSHLAPGTPAEGEEYSPRDNQVYPDVNGHGTHVMGTAAGVTNNGIGVASASWNVSAMPLRAGFAWLNQGNLSGSGYSNDFAAAVQYAAEMGVRVVSISFGGSQADPSYEQAINFARANNVLIFAAAGNNNTQVRVYPGAYESSIGVAATDRIDRRANFSTYGTWVDIASPGVEIWSTLSSNIYHQESYASWAGTSMATPNAAAVASLVLSEYPDLTDDELKDVMLHSTDNIDAINPTYAGFIGSGRVNARAALARAAGSDLPSPEYAGNSMDHLTGIAVLAWNFDPGQHSDFLRFRIYRDGLLIDSTLSNFWQQTLPAHGYYRFAVTALFVSGESSPANATIYWAPNYGLPLREDFDENLARWEIFGQASTVAQPTFAGSGALRLHSGANEFSGASREFDGMAGIDMEGWIQLAGCPQPGGASAMIAFDGTNGITVGCLIAAEPACVPASFVIPPFPPAITAFDPAVIISPNQWYKYRLKLIGPYLQFVLLNSQQNALVSSIVEVPVIDNIHICQLLSFNANSACYFDNVHMRVYTGGEIQHFGFTETFDHPYTCVIDAATLDGVPLAIGDEIAVFDGELCVGAEVVDGEYPLEINAWRATATDPGYVVGHAISYHVWSAELGDFVATATHHAGGVTFADDIFSRVELSVITGAATDPNLIPGTFALHGAFPNPFNPTTQIDFELPQAAHATLRIYDLLGREVATLVDQKLTRGTHAAMFHGESLASGLYVARLESAGRVANTKLLMIK